MVAALGTTPEQDVPLAPHPFFGPPQGVTQGRQVGTAHVAQFHPLERVPQAFDRVKLRRIPGQLLQMQPPGRPAGQEVLDGLAPMNGCPIPDQEQLARDLAQQHAQEAHHIGRVVGMVLGLQEQPSVGGQGTNRRQMVMRERHPQNRGVAPRRPGAHRPRQQVDARLVYPDERAFLVACFFLRAGQRSRHQSAMAASSRWLARSTGRWTLCSRLCSTRYTWAGWYETPKLRRMTSATRLHVQTSPTNPQAGAPWAKSAGICARCSGVSRGVGPAAGWPRKASTPWVRTRLSHWLTAPGVTPKAAAMAVCFQPCCFNSQARCRRPSRQSSCVVFLLMVAAYHTFTNLCKCQ